MAAQNDHPVRITALAAGEGCAVVRVSGDLDYASERHFLGSLGAAAAAGYRYLVLDVTALTFCDSRGLYCLLSLRWLLHRRDGALLLAGVGRHLADLLAQTSSESLLPASPTVSTALENVPAGHRPDWPPTGPCDLFESPEVRAGLAEPGLAGSALSGQDMRAGRDAERASGTPASGAVASAPSAGGSQPRAGDPAGDDPA